MSSLRMPFRAGDASVAELVPDYLARGFLERKQTPFLRLGVTGWFDVAVEPNFEFGFPWLDGGSDINTITPNDGGRMCQTWNGRLPTDVFAALNIPLRWRERVGVQAAGLGSAELRPISGRGMGSQEAKEQDWSCSHARIIPTLRA